MPLNHRVRSSIIVKYVSSSCVWEGKAVRRTPLYSEKAKANSSAVSSFARDGAAHDDGTVVAVDQPGWSGLVEW